VRAEKAGTGDEAGNRVSWWRYTGVERDVQLTAAGSGHQDQETEKGIIAFTHNNLYVNWTFLFFYSALFSVAA